MAPLTDKCSTLDKCHNETSESKPGRFSFRWLLKRSKSSKSAKEMAQAEKPRPPAVPVSKSCDSGIASFSAVDKCSTFLLWKLLSTRGKPSAGNDKTYKPGNVPGKSFKTSFSCNDVYGMFSASKSQFPTARSSQNLTTAPELRGMQLSQTSQSSSNMNKRNSSVDCLILSAKPGEQGISRDFLPTVCHLVLCKLCLSMIPATNMYSLEDCGCVFCVTCMQQYLLVNIKEGNVTIMCPDADCMARGKILISEIHDLVGEEVYFQFQRFKLNRDVELDPNRTWCPTAGCETICHVQSASGSDRGVSVHCLNCRITFCSSCKLKWHGTKTCEEVKNILKDDEDFAISDDEDSSIKRCPNCHIPIERDEGCAQMMCKRCKHVFCWHCLASLDDDFLLRHYDKGPCRNKLGHSRASMIWHRTQVVGIFAGFSFLLLVASPVLLLAAPCLLCCRCKNCKFFYEEATPL